MVPPSSAAPMIGVPASTVPQSTVLLPMVGTSGTLVPTVPSAPQPLSTAEALQALTQAIAGLQLQMIAVNHHLADQGAWLSALDGRPAFPQFGLPGFGGVPALPAASAPVISEVAAASAESAVCTIIISSGARIAATCSTAVDVCADHPD